MKARFATIVAVAGVAGTAWMGHRLLSWSHEADRSVATVAVAAEQPGRPAWARAPRSPDAPRLAPAPAPVPAAAPETATEKAVADDPPAERAQQAQDWYVQLTSGQPYDPGRTRKVKDDLGALLDQRHVVGTVIDDVECYPGACAIRLRSTSRDSQTAVSLELATETVLEGTRVLLYDKAQYLTTIYVANPESGG